MTIAAERDKVVRVIVGMFRTIAHTISVVNDEAHLFATKLASMAITLKNLHLQAAHSATQIRFSPLDPARFATDITRTSLGEKRLTANVAKPLSFPALRSMLTGITNLYVMSMLFISTHLATRLAWARGAFSTSLTEASSLALMTPSRHVLPGFLKVMLT